MKPITYTVLGEPRSGKNSQKIARAGQRRFVRKSKAASAWLATAHEQLTTQMRAKRLKLVRGPVRVDVTCYQKVDRCDVDNMVSLVYDALKGVCIEDDKTIQGGLNWKYVDRAAPRVDITITPLPV